MAESFFATLKEELLYRGVWPTRVAAKRAIFEYVEVFYNRQRMHSTLGYLTPVAYEARRRDMTATQSASALSVFGSPRTYHLASTSPRTLALRLVAALSSCAHVQVRRRYGRVR